MKKITVRISTFLLLTMFGLQVHAQGIFWTENGTYKIGARGTDLFMTINGATGALEWQTELAGDDPTQVWAIVDHRTPASASLMEITSQAGGIDWTMTTSGEAADHPNYTLTVEQRLPKEVAPGDWSGKDQFQRRKAKVNADGDPDSSGSNPSGNNALFLQTPWGTNSRYGLIPSAPGDPVKFDGGGIDVIDFHLVAAAVLSSADFDTSSIFISISVNDELTIKGLPSNVKQVSVYSLLGQEVLSSTVNSESIKFDVNTLKNGMYLVKIASDSGIFTKKIVKH